MKAVQLVRPADLFSKPLAAQPQQISQLSAREHEMA